MIFRDETGLLTEPTMERLGDGTLLATWAEGPVWLPTERVLRYSDIPGDRILVWDQATGMVGIHRDQVGFTNGRTTGLNGEVIQCSHGNRSIEIEESGTVRTLVDSWCGHRFNSPNDVVVKSDGSIWFTDPSYGILRPREGHPGVLEYGDHWVFRFDPQSGDCDPVITDIEIPNGIAFSPDESLLYVCDNSIDMPSEQPNPSGTHAIRVYRVVSGRRCKGGRDFVTVADGIADGIRVDELGNVWTAQFSGIHVYDQTGREIAYVASPHGHVGNLCFGGDDGTDLFMLCATQAYRLRTRVRDASHLLRVRED